MKQSRTTALLCAALLTAACAVPAMPAPSAFAEELTAGGFRYEENDGSVCVTGLTCERDEAPASLTIPKTIEGKPVTEIGYGAFRGYSIREILLHDGITKIGMSAFSSSAIGEIRIPDSVTSLGLSALSGCKNLKSVVLPKNLEYVPRGLCSGCASLEQITLPENVQEISPNAFNACTALKSFQIPESVVTIGYEAFADCSALSSIKIPDTVKAIGNNAFAGTPWIEAKRKISPFVCSDSGKVLLDGKACTGDIVIPDTVERINEEAFSKNNDLTGVTIPESVTEFGAAVFAECDALKHVELPANLKRVPETMFAFSEGLEQIKLPDSVQEIGMGVFLECTALKSVELPDGLKTIGEGAFLSCEKLEQISFPASVETCGAQIMGGTPWLAEQREQDPFVRVNGNLIDAEGLSGSICIPADVHTVCSAAFMDCPDLTDITVPATVKVLGAGAFYNCDDLKTLAVLNPECEIKEPETSTEQMYEVTITPQKYSGVLYGDPDSTAQKYAEAHTLQFDALTKGDLDGDHVVNVVDAQSALREYTELFAGNPASLTPARTHAADVDRNGSLTVEDAQLILKYYTNNAVAGKAVTWEMLLNGEV